MQGFLPYLASLAGALSMGLLGVASLDGAFEDDYLVGVGATGSRSMSHADDPLPGIVDPEDRVLLKRVRDRGEVVTLLAGRDLGAGVAGEFGDAIVFLTADAGFRPILHRALAWVVYNASADAYDVPELGLRGVVRFSFPDVGAWDATRGAYVRGDLDVVLSPERAGRHDGFLTKGDYNAVADQDAFAFSPAGRRIPLVAEGAVLARVVDVRDAT